jgi:hypothetical protein
VRQKGIMMNILNKEYLRSTNITLLSQIEGNSINNSNFFKLIFSLRERHFDYPGSTERSYMNCASYAIGLDHRYFVEQY